MTNWDGWELIIWISGVWGMLYLAKIQLDLQVVRGRHRRERSRVWSKGFSRGMAAGLEKTWGRT